MSRVDRVTRPEQLKAEVKEERVGDAAAAEEQPRARCNTWPRLRYAAATAAAANAAAANCGSPTSAAVAGMQVRNAKSRIFSTQF